LAYSTYRFISQARIRAFAEKIRKSSERVIPNSMGDTEYKTLERIRLIDYAGCPPTEVLDALADARKIFDFFEVLRVSWVRVKPEKDPLLIGRLKGVSDAFLIAQWGDDLNINDILQGDEGYVKEESSPA